MLRMLSHRAAHADPHAAARAVAAHVHVGRAWCYGFRGAWSGGNIQFELIEAIPRIMPAAARGHFTPNIWFGHFHCYDLVKSKVINFRSFHY